VTEDGLSDAEDRYKRGVEVGVIFGEILSW
jgi:hypothetical protein